MKGAALSKRIDKIHRLISFYLCGNSGNDILDIQHHLKNADVHFSKTVINKLLAISATPTYRILEVAAISCLPCSMPLKNTPS